MVVTGLHSIFGLFAVSSSSNERVGKTDFSRLRRRTSTSKRCFTAIKSVTSTTSPGGVQRRRKNKDENGDGALVAKVVENPYSKVESARPDLRKSLSDFLEEARDFVGDEGPPRWFSPLECGAPALGSPLLLYLPGSSS